MMNSLFEQYPDAWTRIEAAGFVSLTAMARRFKSNKLMDTALGYSSAANKWNRGKMPGADAERKASDWLSRQNGDAGRAVNGNDMLVVICPEGVSAKAQRLLAFLGCEVEAI